MKSIVLALLLMTAAFGSAQNSYEKGMTKAFELWENEKTEEAVNLFERISNAEPEKWIPHYYIAQMNILKSWRTKDESALKNQLDIAQEHLNAASRMQQKDNPELMVLQAQLYTVWIAFDGMTYGMKYSAKVTELYNKAKLLDPQNPRVLLSKAEWEMGSAKYFGKDPTPYCEDVKKAIGLFDTYVVKGEFYPDWGREHAKNVLNNCSE